MPKGIAKNGKRKSSNRVPHIVIICEICGKERDYMPSELQVRKKIRFCSMACRGRGQMDGKIMQCLQCLKDFYIAKSRIKRKFCSKQCKNEYRKGKKLSSETIEKIKNGMAIPEVIERLKTLNSRKRSPQTDEHKRNWLKSRGEWTEDQRNRVSNKLVGKFPSNMVNGRLHSHYKHGHYDINGRDIFFRSKWEANYALYLDFLIKQKEIDRWEYEPDVFIFHAIKFGTRSYRPDFKIYTGNRTEYHEVKGYMDATSKTKLKRMDKFYPHIKIVLIDQSVYKSIYKFKKLLKFY